MDELNEAAWLRGRRLAEDHDSSGSLSTAQPYVSSRETAFVIEPPKLDAPKVQNFRCEQFFEGAVLSVDDDARTFWARLADRTSEYPDENAKFALAEISRDDWPLIVPGALFTWVIGCESRDGQIRRVSDIRFRRIFSGTAAAVESSKQRAAALADLLAETSAYPPPGDFP